MTTMTTHTPSARTATGPVTTGSQALRRAVRKTTRRSLTTRRARSSIPSAA